MFLDHSLKTLETNHSDVKDIANTGLLTLPRTTSLHIHRHLAIRMC